MNYNALHEEFAVWVTHNFPNAQLFEPLYGLIEEVGELAHADLKMRQSIRTDENHAAKKMDAVGDIFIYLMHYCHLRGVSVQDAVAVYENQAPPMPQSYSGDPLLFLQYTLSRVTIGFEVLSKEATSSLVLQGIGNFHRALQIYCNQHHLDMGECIRAAWETVKVRDWIKYPNTKGLPPQPAEPAATPAQAGFEKALQALALEVPEAVHRDIMVAYNRLLAEHLPG